MSTKNWFSLTIFDKKSATLTVAGTSSNSENQQLAEELHKPVISKFNKCKVYS